MQTYSHMKTFLFTQDNFSKSAAALRKTFDDKFANPLQGHSDRFVWDYWHVPDQYTLLRTPAEHYFESKVLKNFLQELTTWGQNTLGCVSISPPWLSCYIEGCEQKLHSDNPHGPWAYVFSLSQHHNKHFHGGETLILRPERLDFWSSFTSDKGFELPELTKRVAPKFNRLTVFDPRLPHAVTRVSGTQDPRHGRLVIHGWFTQPQPIVRGPLSVKRVQSEIHSLMQELEPQLNEISPLTGFVSFHLDVASSGKVTQVKLLANTLMSKESLHTHADATVKWLKFRLSKCQFGKISSQSTLILPLVFE